MEYQFPEDFDADAKDLIISFFEKDPLKRLGAGPPGSGRDFKALKKHPFFAGIDWKNLNKIRPPLRSKSVIQKNPFNKMPNKSSFEKG